MRQLLPGVGPACCDALVIIIEPERESHITLSGTS